MTPQDAQDAAYDAFRTAFEAWHFRSEGSSQTAAQPISVPTDVAPEEAARDALQRAFDSRG